MPMFFANRIRNRLTSVSTSPGPSAACASGRRRVVTNVSTSQGPGLSSSSRSRALGERTPDPRRDTERPRPERQEGDGEEDGRAVGEEGHAYGLHRPVHGSQPLAAATLRVPVRRPGFRGIPHRVMMRGPNGRTAMTSSEAPTVRAQALLRTHHAGGLRHRRHPRRRDLRAHRRRRARRGQRGLGCRSSSRSWSRPSPASPTQSWAVPAPALRRRGALRRDGVPEALAGLPRRLPRAPVRTGLDLHRVPHLRGVPAGRPAAERAELAHPRRLPRGHRRHRLLGHPAVLGRERRVHAWSRWAAC